MNEESLLDRIREFGGGSYQDVRRLSDGTIIGIGDLMYTRAIYMDMDLYGWGRRFCFEDKERATCEYEILQTGDDQPSGWIARRGR